MNHMTVQDVADMLGVSRQRVHELVKLERIKVAHAFNSMILLDRQSVLKTKAQLDEWRKKHGYDKQKRDGRDG